MLQEKQAYEQRLADEKAALEEEIKVAKQREEEERLKREEDLARIEKEKALMEKKLKELIKT